jgi:hypothetical protein
VSGVSLDTDDDEVPLAGGISESGASLGPVSVNNGPLDGGVSLGDDSLTGGGIPLKADGVSLDNNSLTTDGASLDMDWFVGVSVDRDSLDGGPANGTSLDG